MKAFSEALKDSFVLVKPTSPEEIQKLRSETVVVDDEGYHSFSFGEHKEYELCIEPLKEDNLFQVALYKNRVLLTEKLLVKGG